MKPSSGSIKSRIPNKSCQFCGWDKAFCDRHRIVEGKNGGVYSKENVVSLCPNCHRLIHLGLLDKNSILSQLPIQANFF